MKKLLLLAFALCSLPCFAANSIYISQTAQGAANGTSCANSYAATAFNSGTGISAGTTVYVCSTGGEITTNLAFPSSGTSGNPITLDCSAGGIMDAHITVATQYWVIQNCTWDTAFKTNSGTQAVIQLTHGANAAFGTIQNNHIDVQSSAQVLWFGIISHDIVVQNNYLKVSTPSGGDGFDTDVFDSEGSYNVTVQGNVIAMNIGAGDQSCGGCHDDLMQFNAASGNQANSPYNWTIRYNQFIQESSASKANNLSLMINEALGGPSGTGYFDLYSNTFQCVSGGSAGNGIVFDSNYSTMAAHIYNNTIVENAGACNNIFNVSGSGSLIAENNIIYNTDAGNACNSCGFTSRATNLWFGPNIPSCSATSDICGQNPLFANYSASNFTLQSSSPGRNAGTNIGTSYNLAPVPGATWPNPTVGTRPASGAWDIGAYQVQSTCSATAVIPPPTIAPFSGLTGAGTVVSVPEPANFASTGCFGSPLERVSDANTSTASCTAQGQSCPTGKANISFIVNDADGEDNQWSYDDSMFWISDTGGTRYLMGFTPSTLATSTLYGNVADILLFNNTPQPVFSHVTAKKFYAFGNTAGTAAGTILSSYLANTTWPTLPTRTTVYDFASSGNCVPNTFVNETDGVSIDLTDNYFGTGFSNNPLQGFGTYIAQYKVGSGCSAWNLATGNITGDYGSTGAAVCVNCSGMPSPGLGTIHNVKFSPDGKYALWAVATCTTTCFNGNSPYIWQVGTTNVYSFCGLLCSGHWVPGFNVFINQYSTPFYIQKNYQSQTGTSFPATYPPGVTGTFDSHPSWWSNTGADQQPFCTSTTADTSNPVYTFATAAEIICMFAPANAANSGLYQRYFHTYAATGSQFSVRNGIMTLSQGRTGNLFMLMTSPMANSSTFVGQLGDTSGNFPCSVLPCRGDVFVGKISSGSVPSAVTFSPVAGTYTSSQAVTLSTTAGAIICWNTTGTPATNTTTGCASGSTLYTGFLTVAASETIYAVAGGTGFVDGAVSSAAYVINTVAAAPTFSPAAGTYTTTQSVTISTVSGTVICYTTNGTTPATNGTTGCTTGTKYTTPVSVSVNETLKAIAGGSTFVDSSVSSAAYVIKPFASTPTFSPIAGTYTGTQSVTISALSGTVICYTTNGTTPATNGTTGCTTGTLYSTPVSVSASETVKAIAGGTNFTDGTVGSAAYVIQTGAAIPTFAPVAGTYTSTQSVSLSTTSGGAIICYNTTGAPATNGTTGCTTGTKYTTSISVSSSETLYAVAGGTGFTDSTVGSASYVILTTASTPTFVPAAGTYTGSQNVTVSSTSTSTTLCYTTDGTTPATNGGSGCALGKLYTGPVTVAASLTLKAIAGGPGYADSSVGLAAYTINTGAATPTFLPIAGTYSTAQNVALSTTSAGAIICFTLNGTSPATNGTTGCTTGSKYTGAINVTSSLTIKAVAGGTGFTDSSIGSAAYTILSPATKPVFSPIGGTYASTQSVTITAATGGVICYTIDGTTPSTNGASGCTHGTLYSGAISVATSETLTAIAGGTGFTDSPTAAAAYIINTIAATPTFLPPAGNYAGTQNVAISSTTAGAVICWNFTGAPATNGSTGCTTGTLYTGAVPVPSSSTLFAIAGGTGLTDSAVGSAAYVISPPPTGSQITGNGTISGTGTIK